MLRCDTLLMHMQKGIGKLGISWYGWSDSEINLKAHVTSQPEF
jgi:hypothetical protein